MEWISVKDQVLPKDGKFLACDYEHVFFIASLTNGDLVVNGRGIFGLCVENFIASVEYWTPIIKPWDK